MTKKLKCNCNHPDQERRYSDKRVHNKTAKEVGSNPVYRCTVCLTERTDK